MRPHLTAALLAVATALVALQAQAALLSTDGGLGVYDTTNNVTWTANGNLIVTMAATYSGGSEALISAVIAASGGVIQDDQNGADTPELSGTYYLSAKDFNLGGAPGAMSWWGAQAWVNYLNAISYGGSNQWALPTTIDAPSSEGYPDGAPGDPLQSSSQLAELFYGNLGEVKGKGFSSSHNANDALFSNLEGEYWSGTQVVAEVTSNPPNYGEAWSFFPGTGQQPEYGKAAMLYALAFSPGQLGQIANSGAGSGGGSNDSDGPIPLWALAALGASLAGIAARRLQAIA